MSDLHDEQELLASIARKIIERADYLDIWGATTIRIDSCIEGFTDEEIELMQRIQEQGRK